VTSENIFASDEGAAVSDYSCPLSYGTGFTSSSAATPITAIAG